MDVSKRILVVDDKANVRQLLQEYLSGQGYSVETAVNGREALYAARHQVPDVILLDLMMPEMDGYAFLKEYRRERQVPVIIITAREEETDTVLGLELGADDYIIKPFRMRELVARIRAVLRRGQDQVLLPDVLEVSGVRLDVERHQVQVGGQEVRLALREFELLELLLRNAGRVMTRGQLIDRIWGANYVGDTKTLDVHVKRLRAKIEEDPAQPRRLITVRGLGYKFEG